MKLKNKIIIGSQVVVTLIVVPFLVYRGLHYFRPIHDPAEFKASRLLVERMNLLQSELSNLQKEVATFEVSDDPEVLKQRSEHYQEINRISDQLLDLEHIYQEEELKMQQKLKSARDHQTRSYYDFALFVGTVWIIISAFVQVAFFKMGLNIFGLASVLIGTVGVLSSMQQTPTLSMWILMLFFSILAIAFLITGYRIANKFEKKEELDDKDI
ncbi:MAG: hypothetical protein WD055_03530 [Candidatus Dependentiae bacterium]